MSSVLLETKWVLPDELRKISVRSSGYFPDPDLMGQGALRNPNIKKKVPEPLQSKLRAISGVTNARVIIIPAGVVFSRDSTGMLSAAISVVLTDPRLGDIKYRTITTGQGVTPDAALRAGVRHHGTAGVTPRMTIHQATLIQGDGIGPEITAETVKVLAAAGVQFEWEDELAGVAAVDATGTPLPDATIDSIRRTRLALKGPLTTPVGTGFRSVNVGLRKEFELYANIRPAKTIIPGGRYENVDIVMVRENLEGLYVGYEHFIPIGDDPRAVGESIAVVTRVGCERVIRYAFEYALTHGRKKVTIVHKANILKMVSGLFLEVGKQVAAEYAGRVASNDMIVDNTAMQLVMRPEQFDVMVTTNMFGDILSDEVSGLVGGLGLAPGANIGTRAAIFEAVHGSAPDIAGKGVANPSAQMLAAAMMLDHLGELDAARRLRRAVEDVIVTDGIRTRDLGGSASTKEFGDAVARRVAH